MKVREILNSKTRVWFYSGIGLIMVYSLIDRFDNIKGFASKLLSLTLPLIIAFFISFLLAPLHKILSKYVVSHITKNKRTQNVVSTIIVMILLLVAVSSFLLIVVPQLITSIQTLINTLPHFFNQLNSWVSSLSLQFDLEQEITQWLSRLTVWIEENFEMLLNGSYNTLLSLWTKLVDLVWGFVIGLLFLVVLLTDRESLSSSIKKLTYATIKEDQADKLVSLSRIISEVFRDYFLGQALDSFILGVIIAIILGVLSYPYALLIGVIIMITNMIPFFGPFLGAIPSAFILMTVDISYAFNFALIILIAQQIDGNIISPAILGDSLQLPSVMIIFAITVFGGLFGILGMIFGVPTFAVIYRLIKYWMNKRLEKI